MLDILPFLTWLSAITSAVVLVVSWRFGDLRRANGAILLAWFVVAVYFQFFSATPFSRATGLVLQTMLAVGLLIRFRLNS